MTKSSATKKLNKIHTYAQDLQAARQTTDTPTVATKVAPVPHVPPAHVNPIPQPLTVPSTTPVSTSLIVPPKASLPTVRTMENDSRKTNPPVSVTTKQSSPQGAVAPTPSHQHTPLANSTQVKQIASDLHQNSISPQTAVGTEPSPERKEKIPKLQKRDTAGTPAQPQKIMVPKDVRDTTYAATVITDTKRKRFSVWREIGKKLNTFIKTKTAKNKNNNNYTAPVIPLEKGLAKSTVTKTSKPSLAEYAALKERIKSRPVEAVTHSPQHNRASIISSTSINPSFDNDTALSENAAELEKTRAKLLSTIEREVGVHHESPTPPLTTVNGPVFVTLKHNTTATALERDAFETPVGWDYYTDTDETDKTSPTLTPSQTNPTLKTTTPVPTIAVPHSVPSTPNRAPINPTETQNDFIAPNIITPEIPVVSPEPVAQNTLVTPAQVAPENSAKDDKPTVTPPPTPSTSVLPEHQTEFVSPDQTTGSNLHYPPSPVFIQPKILPSLPAEYQELTHIPTPTQTHRVTSQPTVSALPTDVVMTQTLSAPATIDDLTTTTPPEQLATTPPRTNTTPTSPSKRSAIIEFITRYTQTFMLGGLIMATIVVIGGIAISSYIAQRGNTEQTFNAHQYFNSSTLHPVSLSPLSPLTITEALVSQNNAIGVSEIIFQNKEKVTVSPAMLTNTLQLPIDPAFSGILLDMRFGWYREEPFIVLRYSGDSIARGAMLQWERTMHTDLIPLFGIPTAATATPFIDATINNIDIRKKINADGQEFIYGVVAPGHIIITTTEMSFLNLANNFNVR